MKKFIQNILWATDFSEESRTALRFADYLAEKFDARLIALHVVPDFSLLISESVPEMKSEIMAKIEMSKTSGKAKIDHMCDTERICPAKALVKEGSTPSSILEAAKEEQADLIVIGRKGASGREKSFLGNVAYRLIRTSDIPILITKQTDKLPELKNILVPTDFSNNEDIERDYAWKVARVIGANLTFLYVLELFGHEFRLTDEMFDHVLKKLKARRREEHVEVEIKDDVTRAFNAAEGIIDYAEKHHIDLIIMSSVVRRIPRIFLGSTTEKVIMYSTLPVLAIPPVFD